MLKYPTLVAIISLSLILGIIAGQQVDEPDLGLLNEYHLLTEKYLVEKNNNDFDSKLKQALEKINYKDYNKETNNCFDSAKRLAGELEKDGFSTAVAINQGRTHAWTIIGVESTNGTYKVFGDKRIDELRDKNGKLILD
jgi:hypothetical protein